MRYSISVSEYYEEDENQPARLDRVAGRPIGLRTDEWPRWNGRPMQHSFTIDLSGIELDIPAAAGARALAVFVDSYYELDLDSSAGITVIWLTQAQIDAHPETMPPDDFVVEFQPGRQHYEEDESEVERVVIELEPIDEAEDESSFGDSFIGGEPIWGESGEPEQLPEGAFVLQVMSYGFPLSSSNACLFVFEGGAYLQAEYPDDNDRLPWPEAIAASRELVVLDEPPAADAIQKWGGIPRGISSSDWPTGASHIVTWIPEPKPESMDEDAVAYALFGRLSKRTNWGDELSFYSVREIMQSDLDEWDPDDLELPDGAEVLEERAIELRELPPGTTWRDLQTRNFAGPRVAWRRPDHKSARAGGRESVLQLTDELLPVSPGRGTLHVISTYYPIWQPAPGAPQATEEAYVPKGTLYETDTTAAIVVGWQIGFEEYSVLPEKVEALERSLLSALATRGLDLTLFVPGDTTTDREGEVHGDFVLGRSVVVVEANDSEPGAIDRDRVRQALAELPELDAGFWREALAFVGETKEPEGPATYLLSWGPLCCGSLYVGVAAERDGEHVHDFVANQDMEQEWSSSGIDGVYVDGAEFNSVTEVELTDEELATATGLDGAGFWLICRYD